MITLIAPYPELSNFAIRSLSGYLRKNGFQTRIIFLPDPEWEASPSGTIYSYPEDVLDKVVSLCEGSSLIGISFFTYLFDRAVQLTAKLKKELPAPVIWGGKHASLHPEEALEHADLVCLAEGEDSLLELANRLRDGKEYHDVENLWLKDGKGGIIKNSIRPLNHDLDSYGQPDWDLDNHYIWLKSSGDIVPTTYPIIQEFFEEERHHFPGYKMYSTMTSRGCPYKCTYCFTFQGFYPKQKYLRSRSVDHVMEELLAAKKNFSGVGVINICDDSFLSRTSEEIEEFCKRYKETIDMPFTCLARPSNITEAKLQALVDAGLRVMQVGVESACESTKKLYNRQESNERIMAAILDINKFKDKLFPIYDFIVDCPYESRDELFDSIRFIIDIPRPYRLQIFSLIFYPGTKLFDRAIEDGLIQAGDISNYRKRYKSLEKRYANFLLPLFNRPLPKIVYKILASKPAILLFDNPLFNTLGGLLVDWRQKRRRH